MGDHSDNAERRGRARLSRYFISRFIVILIMRMCSAVRFSIFRCDLRGSEEAENLDLNDI